ncbi:MAG: lytic transglycosylase domain-containing protein [Anaerolineae bacterium]|nr:lytic transglycosylase domain-containing protein [Anaerolineae bacterium]
MGGGPACAPPVPAASRRCSRARCATGARTSTGGRRRDNVNPNLLATLIQIESCGSPDAISAAGAAGLFQVMPFNFAPGDDFFDVETNARRGIGVLLECLGQANYDAGRAMACYNGGPGTLNTVYTNWYDETQRFYTWGTGIYADALAGRAESATLDRWLAEGGAALCQRAAAVLRLE